MADCLRIIRVVVGAEFIGLLIAILSLKVNIHSLVKKAPHEISLLHGAIFMPDFSPLDVVPDQSLLPPFLLYRERELQARLVYFVTELGRICMPVATYRASATI